jgi:seryl-tRNA synthetase
LIVSLLENYQTEEGTVMVPKALVPLTGFAILNTE